jgi:hypothetical protein
VAIAGSLRFPRLNQLIQRVFPDRFEHPEARFAFRTLVLDEQGVVDERRDHVEGGQGDRGTGGQAFSVLPVCPPVHLSVSLLPPCPPVPLSPYVLCRVQREAAGEDGEAAEEELFFRGEEVVAPGDRVAQGLLAEWEVAGTGGEELEAAGEAGSQRLRGEDFDAGGGQLDRQRQPVEAGADLGDGGRVGFGQGEGRVGRADAGEEERDRRSRRHLRR